MSKRIAGSTDAEVAESAEPFIPDRRTWKAMREAVQACRGCPLYREATQAVFGEGPGTAPLMFVGEVPGDKEDIEGKPFVGPAGRVLDQALDECGIDRGKVYVTNAVKHFKYTMRGKKRLHAKPSSREISACRPWLEAEVEKVSPSMIVALGATAAQSMFGRSFRVTKQRGQVFESDWAAWSMATVHPSSLLRIPDRAQRDRAWEAFVADVAVAGERLKQAGEV